MGRPRSAFRGCEPRRTLVKRDFDPTAVNRLWCADITYIRTWEGWLYLVVRVVIADVRGGRASASVTLVPFGTAAASARRVRAFTVAGPSRIAIFGHTGFVSASGLVGVLLGCFGTRNCAGTITLTAQHAVIATRHGPLLPANNRGLVRIALTADGRRLLATRTPNVNVAVRDSDGPTATATVTIEHVR